VRAADPARSRIVLVGPPYYQDKHLPDIPQVAENLKDLVRVFTDPLLSGFRARHCVTVPAEAGVEEVGDLLHEAAAQAEDLLLFYYAGHGVLGRTGELYLGLRNTRFRAPEFSALRFETVRGTFLDSPALNRVVIVDSCYSGRAIGQTLGADEQEVLGQLEISGTYTLTSTAPNSLALVRDGETHTAFTGRLLRLLQDGSALVGEVLSLGEIYRQLYVQLRAEGLPLPQQRGTATADLLGLVYNRKSGVISPTKPRNTLSGQEGRADPRRVLDPSPTLKRAATHDNPAAARAAQVLLSDGSTPLRSGPGTSGTTGSDPHATTTDTDPARPPAHAGGRRRNTWHARAEALIDDVQHIAGQLGPPGKFAVLARVADLVAAELPERAVSLVDEAQRAASDLGDLAIRGRDVPHYMRALIQVDIERAARIAAEITDDYHRARALTLVAEQFAITDPERAIAIANQASASVMPVTHAPEKAAVYGDLARLLTIADPYYAERFAADITQPLGRAQAMVEVARQLALTDPGRAARVATRAERIVSQITDSHTKWQALDWFVKRLSAAAPDHAERIATNAVDEPETYRGPGLPMKTWSLSTVAQQLATAEPDRAERIAAQITDPDRKAYALSKVAEQLATAEPDHAERITAQITKPELKASALVRIARVVTEIDPDRAAVLADQAESTVAEITSTATKGEALADLAYQFSAFASDRALRTANEAERTMRSSDAEKSFAADGVIGSIGKRNAMESIALALAVIDTDRAERIALGTLENIYEAHRALIEFAKRLANIDPDRAEIFAADIADPELKATALGELAATFLRMDR
jgi:Caspase domain